MTDRAKLGKRVLDRSKADERAVAGYLRSTGLYPEAERAVRTGFGGTDDGRGADPGDICNTPGALFSVKSYEDLGVVERSVRSWLDELDQMRTADLDPVRLLVVRRWHKSDVGDWWLFQWGFQFAELSGVRVESDRMVELAFPVRSTVSTVVPLLRSAGLGEAAA